MLTSIILAAGKGTRMRSQLPKVLQPLAGKPLLHHVLATSQSLAAQQTIVVAGFGMEAVQVACQDFSITWAVQAEQLGTGHAVAQALPYLQSDDVALILYGDVPLVSQATLEVLTALVTEQQPLVLLTLNLSNPQGYGRIVRDAEQQITRIVEQKDASADEQLICEVNTGIMAVQAQHLQQWIARLDNHNAQGEYYLTDIIAMAVADGYQVASAQASDEIEVLGVNDKAQLADLERRYQKQQAMTLLTAGVTLVDPARLDIRGKVEVGMDCYIDANVILTGYVKLGHGVRIGAGCILTNVTIDDGVTINPYSVLENCHIGADSRVGPFARIRPGTVTQARAHIGNFVELKNAQLAEGAKVNHLSYIGDAHLGAAVNIGAGTITCNYDGVNKHQTIIGEGAFIGSNSALVAPVEIGAQATIGAGSVITKDAPTAQLTLCRSEQKTLPSWKRPTKQGCKE